MFVNDMEEGDRAFFSTVWIYVTLPPLYITLSCRKIFALNSSRVENLALTAGFTKVGL